MPWGNFSAATKAVLQDRRSAAQSLSSGFGFALNSQIAASAQYQKEGGADREIFDWLHGLAALYEMEWSHLTGYWHSAPLIDADLDEAVDAETNSRLFPKTWGRLAPKTDIDPLNIIPDVASRFNYRTEAALHAFEVSLLTAIMGGYGDPANVTDGITTTTAVTGASVSVGVSDSTNFAIGQYALLTNAWFDTIMSAVGVGQCTDPGGGLNNVFIDTTATFETSGVEIGDTLRITTGVLNDGDYVITKIISETELQISSGFPSVPSVNENYTVLRPQGNQYALVDITNIPLVGAPGTLTITVPAIMGNISAPQVGSGAAITSNLNEFRSWATTLAGLLLGSAMTQESALGDNDDDITFDPSVENPTAHYLGLVSAYRRQLLAWVNGGETEKIAGVDGDLANAAPYGQLTSAAGGFVATGVVANDTLRIYDGYAQRGTSATGQCGPAGTSDSQFRDAAVTFTGAGFNAQSGDTLRIIGGLNAGDYSISDVLDANNILVSGLFPSTPSVGETYHVLSSAVQGDWPIQSVPGANTLQVYQQWEKTPAYPAASLSFRVLYPAMWEPGTLGALLAAMNERAGVRASRVADLIVRAPVLYEHRAKWIKALVHRAHGSMVKLAAALESQSVLAENQAELDGLSNEIGGFL